MAKKQETCPLCAGIGNTMNVFQMAIPCPVCKGTGKIDSNEEEDTDTKKAD